ncbi:MAG: pectate lyase [Balneolaceae bacterium]
MTLQRILALLFFFSLLFTTAPLHSQSLEEEVEQAMLEATRYMVEEVSTNGGYVNHYRTDFSRQWAELETYDTQITIQPPAGTVGMGNLFLDAYKATGEEYYYEAASKVAEALIWGQHEAGGWHYLVDFAGDRSLKEYYDTIGANAWGFEEYYHYYGNATFDDSVTAGAATFLLRIYLEKLDPAFKPALDKAIDFVMESQYPIGGWPQRYPLMYEFSKNGKADYTSFHTFNDNVIRNNIQFLIDCYVALGEERFLDPIRRGMNFYLITQQGNPQAGWGLQYNMELEPAHARSYEPASIRPSTTYSHAMLLMEFYQLTGDRKFLARIPDAIEWLERSRLTGEATEGGRYTHAGHYEIGTNRPIYNHRSGTGVLDGEYWWDYNDENPIRHYGQKTSIDIDRLKEEYERVSALSPEEAMANSPLKVGEYKGESLPQQDIDLGFSLSDEVPSRSAARELIRSLDDHYRWITTGERISNPYTVSEDGKPSNTAMRSDASGSGMPDQTDQEYISIRTYIQNMNLLINYLTNR